MADFPDYRDDPLQGPQVGGEAPFGRPTYKRRFEALQRGGIEPWLAAGAAGPAQPCRSLRPPRLVPSAGGFTGHAQLADDAGLTLATRIQVCRPQSSGFQSSKITSGTKGGYHARIVAHPSANVTIL